MYCRRFVFASGMVRVLAGVRRSTASRPGRQGQHLVAIVKVGGSEQSSSRNATVGVPVLSVICAIAGRRIGSLNRIWTGAFTGTGSRVLRVGVHHRRRVSKVVLEW